MAASKIIDASVPTVASPAKPEKRVAAVNEDAKRAKKGKKDTKAQAKKTTEIAELEEDASTPAAAAVVEQKAAPVASVESPEKSGHCLDYIRLFKSDPTAWKFNKVKQSWILNAMYSAEKVPKEEFSICKKYIEKLTGAARKSTLAKAQGLVKIDAANERAMAVVKILSKAE